MDNKEIIKMSAHEMNSPISVIHGYADLIECGIIKGNNAMTMAGKIKKEAKRLSRFVDEMSVFTGIMEGTVYAERLWINIEDVLEKVIEKVREDIKSDFNVQILGSGRIYANRELFKILITHIFENAIIYNESSNIKIICNICSHDDRLLLTFEDNGIGIEEEERKKVFECFYRENKEYSRKLGGNGMGLAICRAIAEAENMNISISDSTMGGISVVIEKLF